MQRKILFISLVSREYAAHSEHEVWSNLQSNSEASENVMFELASHYHMRKWHFSHNSASSQTCSNHWLISQNNFPIYSM